MCSYIRLCVFLGLLLIMNSYLIVSCHFVLCNDMVHPIRRVRVRLRLRLRMQNRVTFFHMVEGRIGDRGR